MAKRRKSLGSDPTTHRFLASGYAHSARISAQNVTAALKRGDCLDAASNLFSAIADASALARERYGAGAKARGRSMAFATRRSLQAKFVKQCVKAKSRK